MAGSLVIGSGSATGTAVSFPERSNSNVTQGRRTASLLAGSSTEALVVATVRLSEGRDFTEPGLRGGTELRDQIQTNRLDNGSFRSCLSPLLKSPVVCSDPFA